MAGTPDVTTETHDGLRDLAKKHQKYSDFQADVLRLAENVWHHVRSNGDQAKPEDVEPDDAEDIQQPADDPEDEGTVLVTPVAPTVDGEPAEPVKNETPASPTPADGDFGQSH